MPFVLHEGRTGGREMSENVDKYVKEFEDLLETINRRVEDPNDRAEIFSELSERATNALNALNEDLHQDDEEDVPGTGDEE
jgi:hypothetical protein